MTIQGFTLTNKTVLLAAKRGSGKSCLIKYMISENQERFEKQYLVCPTESVNSFFKGLFDPACVFDSYEEEWVESLIARMTELNRGRRGAQLRHVLLVLDDCIADVNMHQSPSLKKLFSRGRHVGIGVIVSTQYLYSVPPLIRNNSDFVLCGQSNRQSLQILADEFACGDIDRAAFFEMFSRATRDYGFLLVNNNTVQDSSDLNQLYGVVRCPPEYI